MPAISASIPPRSCGEVLPVDKRREKPGRCDEQRIAKPDADDACSRLALREIS